MKNSNGMVSWTLEYRGSYYTGYGKTVAEAKADAQRVQLLSRWGQRTSR